jgi:FMN phosphatase YigB (HAD superfamily)
MADSSAKTLNGRIIEAVSIDFWHTLADSTNFLERRVYRRDMLVEWLDSKGHTVTTEEVSGWMEELAAHWMETWQQKQHTLNAADAAEWLTKRAGMEPSKADLADLSERIDRSLLDVSPEPIPGALEAVQELSRFFKLSLICDTGFSGSSSVDALLERWGMLDYLPVRIYSDQLGVAKPNRAMFFAAAEGLEVPHHRMVHIGDLDATDVMGAKSIGMAALRFDGDKKLEECKHCSMADRVVTSWPEIVQLLLGNDASDALPGGVQLSASS